MKLTSRLLTFLTLFTLLPTAAHAASPSYVVKAGDTLSKIARENQTTVSQLMQVNHLQTDRLSIGQMLSLAGTSLPDAIAPTAPPDLAPGHAAAPSAAQSQSTGHTLRVTGDVLNVRQTPSLEGNIIGKLPYGTVVNVLESGSEWTKIRFNQQEAYVATAYLGTSDAGSPNTPALDLSDEVDKDRLQRLEDIVQPLLHTPYVFGGTTPSGFDCSGFTSYVFRQFGITLPRTSEEQFQSGQAISLDQAQPGDLLFYDSLGTGHVSHVAIYMGNGTIVHANGEDVRFGKVEYMHKLYPFYGVKRYLDIQ